MWTHVSIHFLFLLVRGVVYLMCLAGRSVGLAESGSDIPDRDR